jgi:acylphosphatase
MTGSGVGPPRPSPQAPEDRVRLTAWLHGRVQGVGMRWWVRSRALELGLAGWARNLDDGRVEVLAEGPRAGCEQLLAALAGPGTPGHVSGVTHRWSAADGAVSGFVER